MRGGEMITIASLRSWARFHHMRWLQQRAHRAMLHSVRLDRIVDDVVSREMRRLCQVAPRGTWRAPSVAPVRRRGR